MTFSLKNRIMFQKDETALRQNRLRYAMIAYLAMLAITEILRIIVGAVDFGEGEATDWFFSTFAQLVGMYGVPLLIVYLPERKLGLKTLASELGYRATPKWWVYLAAVVIGFLMPVVSVGVNVVANMILMTTGMWFPPVSSDLTNSVWAMLGAVVFSAVLPAVCEEGLHRGILTRALRPHYRDAVVIALTALFFSLMHSYIRQTFFTFVFGLVVGYLTVKTGSIWPAMIVHFVNNAYLTMGDYIITFNWWGAGFSDAMTAAQDYLLTNLGVGVVVWIAAVAAVGGLLYMVMRKGRRGEVAPAPRMTTDPATGRKLFNGRELTFVRPVDRVWLYTAVLGGVLLTLLSAMQYWV